MPHRGSLEAFSVIRDALMLIQPPLMLFPPPIIRPLHPVGLCNVPLRLDRLKPWTLCHKAQLFSHLLILTGFFLQLTTLGSPRDSRSPSTSFGMETTLLPSGPWLQDKQPLLLERRNPALPSCPRDTNSHTCGVERNHPTPSCTSTRLRPVRPLRKQSRPKARAYGVCVGIPG